MTSFIADKHAFIRTHFPAADGRIALVDFSAPAPVAETDRKLKKQFNMLHWGGDKKSAGMREHIYRQITARDDREQHGFLKSLTSFTLERSLQQMVNGSTIFGMAFTGVVAGMLPVFHPFFWMDSDDYDMHRLKGVGVLTYGAPSTNPADPLQDLRTKDAPAYAAPRVTVAAFNDFVFLHELFHALHAVTGEAPLPAPAAHVNEAAADVFALLVMAGAGKYAGWKELGTAVADLRLLNALNGDPLHMSTPALRAAMDYLSENNAPLTPAETYDKALAIAEKHRAFAGDAALEKAEKIEKDEETPRAQKRAAQLATKSLAPYAQEYAALEKAAPVATPAPQPKRRATKIQGTKLYA